MSTFHQDCPGCGRTLELPESGKGRLGQCPACQTTFTIGTVATVTSEQRPPAAEPTPVPPSEPVAEPAPEGQSEVRPLDQPTPFPDDAGRAAPLEVQERSIEDVVSTTSAIFSDRWKPCLGAFGIVVLATLFFILLPLAFLDLLNRGGAKGLAGVGYVLMMPFMAVFSAYVSVGSARVSLAVARGEANPVSKLISPPNVVMRALGTAILLSLAAGIVVILAASFIGVLNAAGAKDLAGLLSLVAFFVGVAMAFALAWQVWAWLFVCADEKGTSIGSLRASQAITLQNRLASFFLVLLTIILSILGTLPCLLGHIVTTPYMMLMLSVAYLTMTGQRIDDPRNVPGSGL